MGILALFGFKPKKSDLKSNTEIKVESVTYEKQIEVFKSLGYEFTEGVTKELILTDGYAESTWDEIRKERLQEIEQNPFSRLYYYFGWRSPAIMGFNFSDKCIWFDLEFIDPSDQYIWFMERMGAITSGEINYSNISIQIDNDNYEWIVFKVNGIDKNGNWRKSAIFQILFFKDFRTYHLN